MQIQAYRRTERTIVNLFGVDILFAPNDAQHVVADVVDDRACERLLSITEAYREYLGEGQPIAVSIARAPEATAPVTSAMPPGGGDDSDDDDGDVAFDAVLLGSDDLPPQFEVGEATLTQAQVVESAFARSGMNREEWNLNDLDDREALIEGEVVKLLSAHEANLRAAAEATAAQAQPGLVLGQAAEQQAASAAEVNPLLLTGPGGETLDLGTYSEPKLREFAKANGITLPGGKSTKVGDLRLMVAKALTGA